MNNKKLISVINNYFAHSIPKYLKEYVSTSPEELYLNVDSSSGGGGFGTPPTPNTGPGSPAPNIPPSFPPMPGAPTWWYKGPTTPFGNDGEDPGEGMPDPRGNDPRWHRWLKEWEQNNPVPVRQPGETLEEYERRREEYRRLQKAFEAWKKTYRYWYIRTYG